MFPLKDVELVPYSLNFGTKISANPGDYQTTAAVATEFEAKRLAYANAVAAVVAAREAGIRNSQLVATKDSLKWKWGKGSEWRRMMSWRRWSLWTRQRPAARWIGAGSRAARSSR